MVFILGPIYLCGVARCSFQSGACLANLRPYIAAVKVILSSRAASSGGVNLQRGNIRDMRHGRVIAGRYMAYQHMS
ncbi:uncharacterized protein BJX67DRAFT_364340 [Aspergillus lucknowensis]|uniref:Secreted protein n=1 Tax=Aspergillus lucknowensis TaxID=176173 RepID=A0ABR4LFG2_9EURO